MWFIFEKNSLLSVLTEKKLCFYFAKINSIFFFFFFFFFLFFFLYIFFYNLEEESPQKNMKHHNHTIDVYEVVFLSHKLYIIIPLNICFDTGMTFFLYLRIPYTKIFFFINSYFFFFNHRFVKFEPSTYLKVCIYIVSLYFFLNLDSMLSWFVFYMHLV